MGEGGRNVSVHTTFSAQQSSYLLTSQCSADTLRWYTFHSRQETELVKLSYDSYPDSTPALSHSRGDRDYPKSFYQWSNLGDYPSNPPTQRERHADRPTSKFHQRIPRRMKH